MAAIAEHVVQDLEDLSRHRLGLCRRRDRDLLVEVPGTPTDLELEPFQQFLLLRPNIFQCPRGPLPRADLGRHWFLRLGPELDIDRRILFRRHRHDQEVVVADLPTLVHLCRPATGGPESRRQCRQAAIDQIVERLEWTLQRLQDDLVYGSVTLLHVSAPIYTKG
jgi:hypothetical protein